jgi:hypothetical protein
MIDDPGNLANSRVWLFHGDKDMGVPKSTMQELRNFYQKMGVPRIGTILAPLPQKSATTTSDTPGMGQTNGNPL